MATSWWVIIILVIEIIWYKYILYILTYIIFQVFVICTWMKRSSLEATTLTLMRWISPHPVCVLLVWSLWLTHLVPQCLMRSWSAAQLGSGWDMLSRYKTSIKEIKTLLVWLFCCAMYCTYCMYVVRIYRLSWLRGTTQSQPGLSLRTWVSSQRAARQWKTSPPD